MLEVEKMLIKEQLENINSNKCSCKIFRSPPGKTLCLALLLEKVDTSNDVFTVFKYQFSEFDGHGQESNYELVSKADLNIRF